jgi:hypothetical protein
VFPLLSITYKSGIDAPCEPSGEEAARKSKKRQEMDSAADDDQQSPAKIAAKSPPPSSKQCSIEGCFKLRAKGEYCTRHFKDPNAPIRTAVRYLPVCCVINIIHCCLFLSNSFFVTFLLLYISFLTNL